MAEKMGAVRFHAFGGPEVLVFETAPRPEPGPGEVLVRVMAAGVNPIDLASRSGLVVAKGWGADPFPVISGWDLSGVVVETGAGVAGWSAGDEVFAMPRFPAIAGCYAEYATVPADQLARKPRAIDHLHAAAVPLVALTAWQALFDAGGLAPGQRLLMHAAAGGVGHIAVQLAKWRGAHVIGTGSARNEGFVRGLGADEYVDYVTTRFEDVVRDVDVEIDTFGGDFRERAWRVLTPGGILVSIRGPVPEGEAAAHGARAAHVLVAPNAAQLAEIGGLIDAGTVKPVIEAVYPLAEARKAQEHVARGHSRGKVVLNVAA